MLQQPVGITSPHCSKTRRRLATLWDYRRLNCATKDDAYPILPFSIVDLMWGYMQIPMSARDITKMAIITLFGL